ncbi:MAG: Rid family detoxifying hydrolase [Anaerolineae bacterium]|jgi:2-iminobutanoate/2-iminopropanoate deaminase|nr:Rid family detoxifying hydrolase [Anaerolineae bacterium]
MEAAKFEVILTDAAPIPSSGYSQALRLGNLIVTSGYLGTHPDGSGVVPGGFEAEVRQALDNIQAVLTAAGCTLRDVIRVNVSLTDIGKFAEMDRIYREYFAPPYPTRNTIGVNQLWGGAQVGFDVWAVKRDRALISQPLIAGA